MLNVTSLGSGSSGNVFLVSAGGTRILVDSGLGIRKMLERLDSLGVDPASLAALALTHEHGDHSRSAYKLASRYSVPVAGSEDTLNAVLPPDSSVPRKPLGIGNDHEIGELCVRPFPVLHDARQPVGYSISHNGSRACFALDLGRITPVVKEEMAEAQLIVIDCNHDPEMLDRSPYPRHLKERIKSPIGHLSNEDAFGVLCAHPHRHRVQFWLAHLSETNNSPEHVAVSFNASLKASGITDVQFRVLPRHELSEPWTASGEKQGLLFTREA